MCDSPNVTVIMSVYNEIKYVEKTIESVLNQTYRKFEFIIIVDTTDENIIDIIREYEHDHRIRIVYNEKNIGLTKSLNIGIEKAKGFYIARVDADDICCLERLEKQVKHMQENPNLALIGSEAIKIDENGNVIGRLKCLRKYRLIKNIIFLKNCFIHPSVMYKKDAIKEVGGYDENIRFGQDHNLWMRLTLAYECENIQEPLIYYRIHPNSVTKSHNTSQRANGIATLVSVLTNYNLTKLQFNLMRIRIFFNLSKIYRKN